MFAELETAPVEYGTACWRLLSTCQQDYGMCFLGAHRHSKKRKKKLPAQWKRDWCSQKQREVICTCYFEFFTLGWQKCTGRWDKLMTLHYMNQLTENSCLLLRALTHDENDFVAQTERLRCLNPFNLVMQIVIVRLQLFSVWNENQHLFITSVLTWLYMEYCDKMYRSWFTI